MKKQLLHILIIIFLLITFQLPSEAIESLQGQAKIDSLLKELPNMKDDTNGVNLLYNISGLLFGKNIKKGVELGLKGLVLAKKINWKKGEVNCLLTLSNHSWLESNYPKSMNYAFNSLKLSEEINYGYGIAKSTNLLGINYGFQLNYEKSLKYFNLTLKKYKSLNDTLNIASPFHNIGYVYYKLNQNQKSLDYLLKSKNLNIKYVNNKSLLVQNLIYIGNVYRNLKDYNKSFINLEEALVISNDLNDIRGKAQILSSLGDLFYDKSINENKNYFNEFINKSIDYYLLSIKHYSTLGEINNRSEQLYNLAKAYKLTNDHKKRAIVLEEFIVLKDSIFNHKNSNKIAELENAKENELKEKEIEILKKEKENQKLQRYAMFGGIAGLGIIIGLILIQRRKSEKLLLNVLPAKIAKRLKAKEHPIADHFDGASIIFIDLVGFTKMSSSANPKEIVALLNDIFIIFDKLADKHGLEKIKTIGDAYMAVAGIPEIQADHSKRTAQMALDIKKEMKDFKTSDGTEIKFRIGIDCGAVVAGVIGEKKFIYDLWSDAVNTASRMESTGESGQIQITDNFKTELEKFDGNWNFTLRGEFEIKGKGLMKTYYLDN